MSSSFLKSEIRGWVITTKNLISAAKVNKDPNIKAMLKTQIEAFKASLENENEKPTSDG